MTTSVAIAVQPCQRKVGPHPRLPATPYVRQCLRVGRAEKVTDGIGSRIREHRKKAKLSQQALADAAGIHRTTLVRIETGVHTPDTETLKRLADSLRVSLGEVTGEFEAETPPSEALKILLNSQWGQALKMTEEEESWFLSLPTSTWLDSKPQPAALAELVLIRRRMSD